jgi:hypothetical protein
MVKQSFIQLNDLYIRLLMLLFDMKLFVQLTLNCPIQACYKGMTLCVDMYTFLRYHKLLSQAIHHVQHACSRYGDPREQSTCGQTNRTTVQQQICPIRHKL